MTRLFQVTVEGRNFLISMHGREIRAGFFTTRRVRAEDGPAAERAVLAELEALDELRSMVRNHASDPPRFEVEKVVLVDEFDAEPERRGLAWYAEADEEE